MPLPPPHNTGMGPKQFRDGKPLILAGDRTWTKAEFIEHLEQDHPDWQSIMALKRVRTNALRRDVQNGWTVVSLLVTLTQITCFSDRRRYYMKVCSHTLLRKCTVVVVFVVTALSRLVWNVRR